MHKMQQEQAWQRGRDAAGLWKKLKRIVSVWDQRCVAFVKKHKLPAWAGHIPIIAILILSLIGIVAGGIAVVFCIVFLWAFAFILQNLRKNPQISESSTLDNKDEIFTPYDPEPYTYEEYDQ